MEYAKKICVLVAGVGATIVGVLLIVIGGLAYVAFDGASSLSAALSKITVAGFTLLPGLTGYFLTRELAKHSVDSYHSSSLAAKAWLHGKHLVVVLLACLVYAYGDWGVCEKLGYCDDDEAEKLVTFIIGVMLSAVGMIVAYKNTLWQRKF